MQDLLESIKIADLVTVNKIISQSININQSLGNGKIPLIFAIDQLCCEESVKAEHADIVIAFIKKYKDINIVDFGEKPLLHKLCITLSKANKDNLELQRKVIYRVVETLIQKNISLEQRDDKFKETVLFVAIRHDTYDLARLFITNGADLAAKNTRGETPLHIACCYGKLDLVQLLLQANCDVNISDNEGRMAIELISPALKHENINFENILIDLLKKTNKSPLSNSLNLWNYSILLDSTLLAKELLTHEKKLDDYMLNSGLLMAVHSGQLKILKWLVQYDISINFQDCCGDTVLHVAVANRNIEIVTFLLTAGANPAIKNKQEQTPLYALLEELRESLPLTADKEKLHIQQRETVGIIMTLIKKHGVKHYQWEKAHDIFCILFSGDGSLYFMLKQVVHYLLDVGASLPTRQSDRYKIIRITTSYKDMTLLKKMCVEKGPHTFDNICYTAMLAANDFNKKIIGKLIKWGLNINGTFDLSYKYGSSPCSTTLLDYFLVILSNIKDESKLPIAVTFIEFLLDQGASAHVFSSLGFSLLHYACEKGWNNLVLKLLQPKHHYSIDQLATFSHHSPLQVAVLSNQINIARILIEKGADVFIKTSRNETLVSLATEKHNPEMLQLLLELGIDVNIGKREWGMLVEPFLHSPLHMALEEDAYNHHSNKIVSLLLDYSADVDSVSFNMAVKNHNIKLDLIKRMALKIDRHQFRSALPLHHATTNGRSDVLRFLIDEFYDLLRDSIDGHGHNVLFAAIESGNKDCYKQLIIAGEDSNHVGFDELNLSAYALCLDRLIEFDLPSPQGISLDSFQMMCIILLEQEEFKAMPEINRSYQVGICSYKLIALFCSVNRALQFVENFSKPETKSPIHDLCLFNLPQVDEKLGTHWAELALSYGPALTKYLQIAPGIDALLKESPRRLEEVELAAKKLTYNRGNENLEMAQLFSKYNIPEGAFNRILKQHHKKGEDNIPDVFIDGKDFDESRFYMKKLSANDYTGYVLGAMTACCQSVGSAGEVCACYGMRSPNAGFYVIYKRTKEKDITKPKQLLLKANDAKNAEEFFSKLTEKSQQKKYRDLSYAIAKVLNITINSLEMLDSLRKKLTEDLYDAQQDELIAQSLVWISRNGGFVFDSWERLRKEDNRLCWDFLKQVADILILSYGFKRVVIGAGGNTPQNQDTDVISEPEMPIDYYDYRDSHEQLLIASDKSLQNKMLKKADEKKASNITTNLIGKSDLYHNPMGYIKEEVEQLRKLYGNNGHVTFLTPICEQTLSSNTLDPKEFEKKHPHTYVQLLLKKNDIYVALVFRGFIENQEDKNGSSNINHDIIYIDIEGGRCHYDFIKHYEKLLGIHINDRYVKYNNLVYNAKDHVDWLKKQIISIIDTGNLTVEPVSRFEAVDPAQVRINKTL